MGRRRAILILALLYLPTLPLSYLPTLFAQSTRIWNPDERAYITDLSVVSAVAVTSNIIYAATPNGLAIYDRAIRRWRETVGPLDGWPAGYVTAMAADPTDDTAWLAGPNAWMTYQPFTRRLDRGNLPGGVDAVSLDARDPSRGAWFHTVAGWYFVQKGSLVAVPGTPPATRTGSLGAADLVRRLPAFDAVRMRVERDDALHTWRLSSAAQVPVTNEVIVGTMGNGAFQVDPVTYGTEQLPMGILGAAVGAIAEVRGQVCVASSLRIQSPRRGITCFDENADRFTYLESAGLATITGGTARRILITERSIWLATNQGLVRAPRRGGRPVQVTVREGLPDDQVYALAPAPEGAYVGTSHGLALVADTGRSVVVVANAAGPAVTTLAGSTGDTLWAGTAAGIVAFPLPIGGPVGVPVGSATLHDPILAMAMRGDTIVAASTAHLLVRAGGQWRVSDPPGVPIGTIAAIATASAGFVVAGDLGFAWYDPARPQWVALTQPGDVPTPVRDIAATRDYIWVATDIGVLRYEKRVVMP